MSIRRNSSQSQKTQAFRNVIRRGVYCQTQHNTDVLYVLCLELRSPKTTQMSAPSSPRGAFVIRFNFHLRELMLVRILGYIFWTLFYRFEAFFLGGLSFPVSI